MHRLPLQLPKPSISWNRDLPEYVLFNNTLNSHNVDEMDNFINILEFEKDEYTRYTHDLAAEQIEEARRLIGSKNSSSKEKGLRMVTAVVLRAPRYSKWLSIALKIRGNFYYQNRKFESATNDFEMFLFVHNDPGSHEELIEINGNLAIAFYLMRQYNNTKKYLAAYYMYKALMPAICLEKPHLQKLENHITKFARELDDSENVILKFPRDVSLTIPYVGFNKGDDVPLASSTCDYKLDPTGCNPSKPYGVYANTNIPHDSIVLVEHSILQTVNTPLVQCEACFRRHEQTLTCLSCRYKTYCSLRCMKKDEDMHRYECVGYKNLLLLILDASNLLRVFIRTSNLLDSRIFCMDKFSAFLTAGEVFDEMERILNGMNLGSLQYLKMLKCRPDYKRLSNIRYATIVATAFRLTIFIDKQTNIIENYYKHLKVSNKQKLLIVGAILMRLNCNVLTNTFDFEYNYPINNSIVDFRDIREKIKDMSDFIKPVRDAAITNTDAYYRIDLQKDILRRSCQMLRKRSTAAVPAASLPSPELTQSCNIIHRQLSTYKDSVIEVYFNPDYTNFFLYGEEAGAPITKTSISLICERLGEMADGERYVFVRKFAHQFHRYFIDYFLQLNFHQNCVQQIMSLLCNTLGKFRHSCDPNVEVMILENGVVVGKTLRHIEKGEELLVSYKAHYMKHTRAERETFLRQLNITCYCKYCTMPELEEPCNLRLGIICDSCDDVVLTPLDEKCRRCLANYGIMLLRYRTEMKLFDDKLRNKLNPSGGDDRELYIIHKISYLHAKQSFVACNEHRIKIELRFAKFLAFRNFSHQAFKIVREVRVALVHNYEESFLWFTFYAKMLEIIKIILYYNLEEDLYTVSTSTLLDMCTLGLYIVNGQKNHTNLYETYDHESALIAHDLDKFLSWQQKIYCTDLIPLIDVLKKSNSKKRKVKTDPSKMPALAKAPFFRDS